MDHLCGDGAAVRFIARVMGRLATAGLSPRHLDPAAGIFEQPDGCEGDAGAQKIDEAGYEQADTRLGFGHCRYIPWGESTMDEGLSKFNVGEI
jgi:hypothetical protein